MDYNFLDKTDVVKFCREAADVQRCHQWRTIGEYPVGQHSFNMLAVLRILWPTAPISLVWAIVDHDLPERLTGDIPAPSKWGGLVNMEVLDKFEYNLLVEMFGGHYESDLTEAEMKWLKGLDILELWMFARDQIQLGNNAYNNMKITCQNYIERNTAKFAPQILDLYHQLKNRAWYRMHELGERNERE